MTNFDLTCSDFTEMQIMIHDQDQEAWLAFHQMSPTNHPGPVPVTLTTPL